MQNKDIIKIGDKTFHNEYFMSYARLDQHYDDPESFQYKWISKFEKRLINCYYNVIFNDKVKFGKWRDDMLRGNENFPEILRKEIKNSLFFIAFLSENYLNSPWCQEELDFFVRSNSNKLYHERIFFVKLQDLHHEKLPDHLSNCNGYDFFVKQNGTSRCIPHRKLEQVLTKQHSEEKEQFESKLEKLIQEIHYKRNELKTEHVPSVNRNIDNNSALNKKYKILVVAAYYDQELGKHVAEMLHKKTKYLTYLFFSENYTQEQFRPLFEFTNLEVVLLLHRGGGNAQQVKFLYDKFNTELFELGDNSSRDLPKFLYFRFKHLENVIHKSSSIIKHSRTKIIKIDDPFVKNCCDEVYEELKKK